MKNKITLCILAILILTSLALGVKTLATQKINKPDVTITTNAPTKAIEKKVEEKTVEPETETETETEKETETETETKVKKEIITTEKQTAKQTTNQTTKQTTKTTSTTTKKQTTTTTIVAQTSGYEQQMLKMINAERAKYGAPALQLDSTLNSMARTRASELATLYRSDHIRPNGTLWATILDGLKGTPLEKWSCAGENIAYGQSTYKEVTEDWIASPGHHKNIVKAEYTHVGFGCYTKNGVTYWDQIFLGVE
ncbi:MAG: CAP domain-containing protein [Oscillospiraceae bacterium]|nr:CAP domain-containing protein [Candidatus Limimonas coprohippi]